MCGHKSYSWKLIIVTVVSEMTSWLSHLRSWMSVLSMVFLNLFCDDSHLSDVKLNFTSHFYSDRRNRLIDMFVPILFCSRATVPNDIVRLKLSLVILCWGWSVFSFFVRQHFTRLIDDGFDLVYLTLLDNQMDST